MDFSDLQTTGITSRVGRFLDAHAYLSRENVRAARVTLGIAAGIRVVDIGCGTGDGTRALATVIGPAGHILGVDPDPLLLARAAAKGPMPQLGWLRACGSSIRAQALSYDVCWLDRVLAHSIEPKEIVAEVRRLLKPGGRLFSCEIEYSAISFATSTEPLRVLHDKYVRSIRSPDVAKQLKDLLSNEFGSASCSQRREEIMFNARGDLSRALALRLWARTQLGLGRATADLLRSASRDLAALEHARALRVLVPIRWTLMWTSPGA